MSERNCSYCLWIREINSENNHFSCSHPRYPNLYLKQNKDNEWIRMVEGKFYFIGKCKGFIENTNKNLEKIQEYLLNFKNRY